MTTTTNAGWFAEEELTHSIIGTFFYVYNSLGFGFLESAYAEALDRVLTRKGHRVAVEVRVPIYFEDGILAFQRLDMIVDQKVIVEIKATAGLHRDSMRQLLSYLKATKLEVGLLLHFSPGGAKFYRLANRQGFNQSDQ